MLKRLIVPLTCLLLLSGAVLAQDESRFDEAAALLASERNTIDVIDARGDSVVAVSIALPVDPSAPFAEFVDLDYVFQGSLQCGDLFRAVHSADAVLSEPKIRSGLCGGKIRHIFAAVTAARAFVLFYAHGVVRGSKGRRSES